MACGKVGGLVRLRGLHVILSVAKYPLQELYLAFQGRSFVTLRMTRGAFCNGASGRKPCGEFYV